MNLAQILFIILTTTLFISLIVLQNPYTLRLYEKIILFFSFIFAVVLILNPALLDLIAKPLLISRGTDLFFYMYVLLSLWGLLRCHIRLNKINSKLNKLISEVALKDIK
tara:strand:- start:1131 stop:1457 length:327 start_codon:yes stop_codon:yes gene_type:complete